MSDFTADRAIFFTDNSAFATYTLTTAIGPLSGLSVVDNPGFAYPTNMGNLVLTSLSGSATYAATISTVPEPVTFILVGTGLALIIVRKQRGRT
jgi:hypothetical protein